MPIIVPLPAATPTTIVYDRLIQRERAQAAALDRSNQALEESRRQLEIESRRKTDFINTMSHELRTPMNAIIGFSDILKQEAVGPIENRAYVEYAGDIYNGAQHLLKLINSMLDISRIESGAVVLEITSVDLHPVIDRSLSLCAQEIQKFDADIRVPPPDPAIFVAGHDQILVNLISNAVKYGGEPPVVTVDVTETDGETVIAVRDCGPGLDEDEITQALQEFGRVKHREDPERPGTGLGLSFVAHAAAALGGRFDMDSTPGSGTTARLTVKSAAVGN